MEAVQHQDRARRTVGGGLDAQIRVWYPGQLLI
jgi:hypothetical protein